MKQNQDESLQRICDQHILLKSNRQHYEKETDKLINYFGEQFKYNDTLELLGKRFRDKEREFQGMRKENDELRMKTKNLTNEIFQLRASFQDSMKSEDRLSLSKMFKAQSSRPAAVELTNITDNSEINDSLQKINKLKQQVREQHTDYAKQYDRLLQYLFSYLNQQKHSEGLKLEMMSVDQGVENKSSQEMVLVPKKRYEKLIQIYSINMAEITVNELRNKMKLNDSEVVKDTINYLDQNQRQYYQKYADILKGEDVSSKDLKQLFRILAKKVGFQNQWKRYHNNNQNEAVSFKFSLDQILKQKLIENDHPEIEKEKDSKTEIDQSIKERNSEVIEENEKIDEEKRKQQEEKQRVQEEQKKANERNITKKEFMIKINKIINKLQFNSQEKSYWSELNGKIEHDNLFDITQVIEKFDQIWQEHQKELSQNIAGLLNVSLSRSFEIFAKSIETKFKKSKIKIDKYQQIIGKSILKQQIDELRKEQNKEANLWTISKQILDQKLEEITKTLNSSFVFIATGQLYRASMRKK